MLALILGTSRSSWRSLDVPRNLEKMNISLLSPENIVRKYFKQAIAIISLCSKIKKLFHGPLNKEYF